MIRAATLAAIQFAMPQRNIKSSSLAYITFVELPDKISSSYHGAMTILLFLFITATAMAADQDCPLAETRFSIPNSVLDGQVGVSSGNTLIVQLSGPRGPGRTKIFYDQARGGFMQELPTIEPGRSRSTPLTCDKQLMEIMLSGNKRALLACDNSTKTLLLFAKDFTQDKKIDRTKPYLRMTLRQEAPPTDEKYLTERKWTEKLNVEMINDQKVRGTVDIEHSWKYISKVPDDGKYKPAGIKSAVDLAAPLKYLPADKKRMQGNPAPVSLDGKSTVISSCGIRRVEAPFQEKTPQALPDIKAIR